MVRPPVELFGSKELDAKLAELSKVGMKKAARAGVNAGLTVVTKAMRKAINSSAAASDLKKGARQSVARAGRAAIGKSFKKAHGSTGGPIIAKAGFKVAKKQKAVQKTAGRGRSGGVGASIQNIHWFVLGTGDRTQDTTGRETGRMPPIFDDVTDKAASSAGGPALRAAELKAFSVIAREWKRKGAYGFFR